MEPREVPESGIRLPRFQPARSHFDDHRVIADLGKKRRIRARHPNLAAELREFDMQRGAPGGVEMRHDFIEQQDRSKTRHLGDQTPMGEDEADEQCLLLAGRSVSGGDAFVGVGHLEIGQVWSVAGPARGGVAGAIVAQHRAVALLDLDGRVLGDQLFHPAVERNLRRRKCGSPAARQHSLEPAHRFDALSGDRDREFRGLVLDGVLASRKGSAFPPAEIALDGWMEKLIPEHPAIEIEERYRAVLRDNRARDAAAGRTSDGPHLTDLKVTYAHKGIAAADASTGEQKALLIGLVLAHGRLIAEMTGFAPILLLDEIVAHLDPARRAALHVELAQLGGQVWMTGADPALFVEVGDDAMIIEVASGRLEPRQPNT